MTNAEKVLAYLRSIAPTEATNSEIARRTDVKPHQQVFQITQNLMARRAIRGSQAGGSGTFGWTSPRLQTRLRMSRSQPAVPA